VQSKFTDVGLVLGLSQFSILRLPPAASKNTALFKSGQNQPKNNHLGS